MLENYDFTEDLIATAIFHLARRNSCCIFHFHHVDEAERVSGNRLQPTINKTTQNLHKMQQDQPCSSSSSSTLPRSEGKQPHKIIHSKNKSKPAVNERRTMHIGAMLGTSVVDSLVAESEDNKQASCEKLSPSKLNDKTPTESSPQKSSANKSVDSKIPPGGISDISEMGEFDVLAGRGRVVSQ